MKLNQYNKYKESITFFWWYVRCSKQFSNSNFYIRGPHENLEVCYISQSYFALPRQSIRNKSDIVILLKQSLRDVQCMYRDLGVYDMDYREFKQMCREAWSEKFNYLCSDMVLKKKVKIVF